MEQIDRNCYKEQKSLNTELDRACWGRVNMAFAQLPHKYVSIARESMNVRTNMIGSIN